MARPPPRRASSNVNAKHLQTTAQPKYATREPSLKEKLTLPKRFHDPDSWPVNKILDERRGGRQIEYQIEWESHPKTGEVWEPNWVCDTLIMVRLVLTCHSCLKPKSVTSLLRPGRERSTESKNHKTQTIHHLKSPVSRSAVESKRRWKVNPKDES